MATTLHVIFKTHLDIGFTDCARNVVNTYFTRDIPQALRLARDLRQRGGEERFVWTTGSWLIYEYLERADRRQRAAMERAIAQGDIVWHALPFTTHSELMDASLFRFGLSLSAELDKRFGRKTIAAKMTDVPGHTRSIVPLLAAAGVKFLHLGVNPVCPPPRVPPLFVWKAPDGSEVIVNYSHDYGGPLEVAGLHDRLIFAHTGDNCGPPPQEKIVEDMARLNQQNPGAKVIASTLDAFARVLLPHAGKLPVIMQEIGDTWIHGAATDPTKMARFRQLCRLRQQWQNQGLDRKHSQPFAAFSRQLLMIPEHTWGLDEKTHLADYVHYANAAFVKARQRDVVSANAIPERFAPYRIFPRKGVRRSYKHFEASWQEQRQYLADAVKALGSTPLKAQALQSLRVLKPAPLPRSQGEPINSSKPLNLGQFTVRFSPATGAIIGLQNDGDDTQWASPRHPLGLFQYQTFSQKSYDRWIKQYAINLGYEKPKGAFANWMWAIPDLSKPGIDEAVRGLREALHKPRCRNLQVHRGAAADIVIAELVMPDRLHTAAGAPQSIRLNWRFSHDQPTFDLEVSWQGKPATRLPEASWLSFNPVVKNLDCWQLEKMGQWVSPLDVVAHGNRNLHAVGEFVTYAGPDGRLRIHTLDAPLVAPGKPRLLQFDDTQPPLEAGMHFNLHNNVWGTNFPMWYGDDAGFRFRLDWH